MVYFRILVFCFKLISGKIMCSFKVMSEFASCRKFNGDLKFHGDLKQDKRCLLWEHSFITDKQQYCAREQDVS